MNVVKTAVLCLISAVGFSFCFLSVVQFAVFLYHSGSEQFNGVLCQERTTKDSSWVVSTIIDVCLIVLFILQHTLMASSWWKQIIHSTGFGVLTRSLYVIATSLALQIVCSWWQPLFPCSPIWQFQVSPGSFSSFLCFAVHAISWLLVLAVCLTLDYAELMGVKQVYYSILGLPSPLYQKSEEHRRLFQHFRHPLSSSLLVVLWFIPMMCWDRFLLASGFTLYLLLGHSLDTEDYDYLKEQYELKEEQLWQSRLR
ncbi:nurim-like [Apostichopus japonicus]|uniref:nurim-like n=1 Tax=Stichopus japonicus TaxID=307972 RepID=UPI003AB4903A